MHEKVLLLTFFVCFVFKPRGHETNYSKPSVSGSLQIVGDLGENHIKLWGSIGAAVAEAIWMLHKWLSQHLDACKAPVRLYGSSLKPCKSVDSHVTVCFRSFQTLPALSPSVPPFLKIIIKKPSPLSVNKAHAQSTGTRTSFLWNINNLSHPFYSVFL